MSQPNVVLFTWHDAGDWFGCYGYETVDTPHVDRLAREGVRFSQNFSACAICSPSRAAIVTGTLCQRNGVMTLTNSPFDNRIHPHVPHLARRLKDRGYRTALFGVQHEAAHEHVAEIMNFDAQFATDPWPQSGLIAPHLSRWIDARKAEGQPFYAQIGTYDAHLNRFYSGAPARADEPYPPVSDERRGLHIPPWLEPTPASRATVGTLQGLLHRGDQLMGTLLDALDRNGLAENTLVIMCVDHGVGLSRGKATCYDSGTRTGWIMRWPKQVPSGQVVDSLACHVDVLPTVWELLGLPPLAGIDGVSQAALARGKSTTPVRDAVFSHMVEATRSIRTDRWKLIRNFSAKGPTGVRGDCADQHRSFQAQAPKRTVDEATAPHVELYDLQNDPAELHDCSRDPACAEIRAQLDARLWDFLLDHNDFLVHAPTRTPWQRATRDALEEHCRRRGRPCPVGEGPLANAIDAANARGKL